MTKNLRINIAYRKEQILIRIGNESRGSRDVRVDMGWLFTWRVLKQMKG
jgi:hypothetical protein